mgnify:CR=1 FL=1
MRETSSRAGLRATRRGSGRNGDRDVLLTERPFRTRYRRCVRTLVWILWGGMASTAVPAAELEGPSPDLDPEDVVRIQVEALGRNDEPELGHGIEITWNFASPANRRVTGPLERFRGLFEAPVYRPMLDHLGADYSEPRVLDDRAWIGVVLSDAEGRPRGYLFELSRRDSADCSGCWMTDSVLPMPVPADRRQVI